MIPVTKPFLPDLGKYISFIEHIWNNEHLTNNGPYVQLLEKELKKYLNVDNILFVSNGTIALQIAIKAMDLKGEIITTPFSYVATTSSIVWENTIPVFVDIDEKTLNINADLIEDAINENTSAILATHCFGNACNIEKIQRIADKNNLKVIYDAAHCFGTKYNGKSIFEFGDISSTSFHATKLMHSTEGGALFSKNSELFQRMSYMRNFGHDGPENFNGVGINGKNSEFHAAMGLCVLDSIDAILEKRKAQCEYYSTQLKDSDVGNQLIQEGCEHNFAYYPIMLKDEKTTIKLKTKLEENKIYPRRYFYPSLNSLGYISSNEMPVSEKISSSILCLPLFHELRHEQQKLVTEIIKSTL